VSQFLRGAVRLHILHHAQLGPIHGAWMAEELAGHGYKISPGRLYPMLHRMQEEGLLTSRQEVVDGRARRVYGITDVGRSALVEERVALAELASEILGHREEQ
jgi:DNA-binding PadR family transcriptional regulator